MTKETSQSAFKSSVETKDVATPEATTPVEEVKTSTNNQASRLFYDGAWDPR